MSGESVILSPLFALEIQRGLYSRRTSNVRGETEFRDRSRYHALPGQPTSDLGRARLNCSY